MPNSFDQSDPRSTLSSSRPTFIRFCVIFVCGLMAVLLYLDRFCVGIAEHYIKQDVGLSTYQIGFFFSAFFLTYALCQVPSGWLTDRYGSRIMLVIYVLAWSLFTAMMGLCYGFAMLLLMRAATGVGQAGAYPTSASVLSKWVPFSFRGTASSLVAFGGRLGGAITPILTAFLIVLFVPVDKSSLFHTKDLLDGGALCSTISLSEEDSPSETPKSSSAVRRIWEHLPSEVREITVRITREYRPVAPQIQQLEKEGKTLQKHWQFFAAREKYLQADSLKITLNPQDQKKILSALNAIIQQKDFYRKDAFKEVQLGRQGRSIRQKFDDGKMPTTKEIERLNRLLLESTLSGTVGEVYVAGWRPVFYLYGSLGLLVAGILWVVLRNRPREHPRCNRAEQELIVSGRPPEATSPDGKSGGIPWMPLLKSPSMWYNSLGQVGTNIGWVFLVTWFPMYLIEEHQVPILERGIMASVPLFVGWAGMLGGGLLTDVMVRKVGLKWGRRIPWGGSRFIGMTAFLFCPLMDSAWAITIALSVVAFSTDLGTASGWSFCQDVGGKNVGSVLGWGNMWGNLGATASPILLAWVFESYGWNIMFYVCAGAFCFAGFCGLRIDATIPIEPPEEEHDESDQ